MCKKRALQIAAFAAPAFLILGGCRKTAVQDTPLGPLVEISRPNAVGSCDTGFKAFGTWPIDNAEEPFVAAHPIHPNNIVAAWIQGSFQDTIAAVSFDKGQTWKQVPIPLTVCSGGKYIGGGDPWLSFAPNGDLYAVSIAGNSPSTRVSVISKSADSGSHWTAPLVIPGSDTFDPPPDRPSITADPKDSRFVYAVWNGNSSEHSRTVAFSRTTDSGVTWESPRAIVRTAEHHWIMFSQIIVLPNGTLVDLYDFEEFAAQAQEGAPTSTILRLQRSPDRGESWSTAINALTMTPLYSKGTMLLVVDPKTKQPVLDFINASFATDSRNGNLYTVWEDGRFSNFQNNDVAFSMSADGGFTWSAPIRVNKTPVDISLANRQTFHPSVAVAANGKIGLSYYDFRFDKPGPGLATDYWLVQCQPSFASGPSDPACWNEVRLTDSSFNIENAVPGPYGLLFLGDYFGLAAVGNDFMATFALPDNQKVTSIFARRVGH